MPDQKLTELTEIAVPALDDLLYLVDDSSSPAISLKVRLSRLAGIFLKDYCQGRLTLETGVPVSTADQTAKSTIYFTPYQGNFIGLYDGTRWTLYTFTERSLALSGLTSGRNYDVFLYDNAGTLTLELSAAWTNDTTRADALALQDGIYVKSAATTRRYLGTIRTTGTTTTEDSGGGTTTQVGGKRFVWNYHHRIVRPLFVFDGTASWTYSTATWRAVNGQSTNRVEVVTGFALDAVEVSAYMLASNTSGALMSIGIGLDSTTIPYAPGVNANTGQTANAVIVAKIGVPVMGYHAFQWLERANGATGTFFGADSTDSYIRKNGLVALAMA